MSVPAWRCGAGLEEVLGEEYAATLMEYLAPEELATKKDLEGLEHRLTLRISGVEGRMDGLEGRMDGLEGRMDGLKGSYRRAGAQHVCDGATAQ